MKSRYNFHMPIFKGNIKSLLNAFSAYPNFAVGYSFKTNNHIDICQAAKNHGLYAEVVSPDEYADALTYGFSNDKIIYNGVIPDFHNKLECALNGGIVNIDNMYEFITFFDYAESTKTIIEIGIRIHFDIGNENSSRFGFDVNGFEFKQLVLRFLESDYLKIVGLHCHISSGRELHFWEARIKTMIYYAKLFKVKYIDLGGNMYGPMPEALAKQFEIKPPTYQCYANVICPLMKEAYPDNSVKLIIENGTSLVGNAMDLLANIIGVKEINKKLSFILDVKRYDFGFIIKTKTPPFSVLSNRPEVDYSVDIYGCACTEEDIIIKDYKGNMLCVGDVIIFENVGAYSSGNAPAKFITNPLKINIIH